MVELLLATFRPPIDPRLTVCAILALALLWAWRYHHERRLPRVQRLVLLALRLIALAVLCWILLGPVVFKKVAAHPRQHVELTILADVSQSMQQKDMTTAGRDISRFEAIRANWLNTPTLDKLRRVAQVSIKTFASRTSDVDSTKQLKSLKPVGHASKLFNALRQIASHQPHAAVLVLSDGHDTQMPWNQAAVDELTRQHDRVFVVPVGKPMAQGSIRLAAWADANVVIVGDKTTIHVNLTQRHLADAKVKLTLDLAGQNVATRTVAFNKQTARSVTFKVQPPSQNKVRQTTCDYIVRASLVGQSAANKTSHVSPDQHVFITVSPQPLRVLLLEGQPYWDTRQLARILRADAGVKLTAVYQLGHRRIIITPTPHPHAAPHAPATSSKAAKQSLAFDAAHLAKFDVIVLGKSINTFFPGKKVSALTKYVSLGGALVLARGKPWDRHAAPAFRKAIDPLLPVDWGRTVERQLRLSLTPAGEHNPVMNLGQTRSAHALLSALPGMLVATQVTRVRSASIVMLNQTPANASAPMAGIAQLRVGSGQVLAVLGEGLWQWRLLPHGQGQVNNALSVFWSRAVRWLASGSGLVPGQAVTLTADRSRIQPGPGQSITARLTPRYPVGENFHPVITVTSPEDKTTHFKLAPDTAAARDFIARVPVTQTGIYTFSLDPASLPAGMPKQVAPAHVVVAPQTVEQLDTAAQPKTLEKIARQTHGQVLPLGGAEQLIDQLTAINQARNSESIPHDNFAKPWALLLIFFALGIEWWLTRRWGLS